MLQLEGADLQGLGQLSSPGCILMQGIPVLQWSQRNEARRLVTLIDTLYDMRCRLECSAAGRPRQVHLWPENTKKKVQP